MTKKSGILWIDDDVKRKKRADKLFIEFLPINNMEMNNILSEIERRKGTDLLLIDHFLSKRKRCETNLANGLIRGSTLAQIVRELRPTLPIVGISAAVNFAFINSQGVKDYDELIDYDDLTKSKMLSLQAIMDGYKKLSQQIPNKKEDVFLLLELPSKKPDEDILRDVMPDFFIESGNETGLVPEIAKWIRKTLIDLPGILYDRKWAATRLGLKEKYFYKVERSFIAALYNGVFADKNEPRWWGSEIRSIVFKKFKNLRDTYEFSKYDRRISPGQRSICHSCGKPLPEIVAYTDVEYKTKEPMHLRCSISDDKYKKRIHFEDVRIMN